MQTQKPASARDLEEWPHGDVLRVPAIYRMVGGKGSVQRPLEKGLTWH